MAIIGSYGLGLFCRGVLLVYLAGAASSTPDDATHVIAVHGEPVTSPLSVPLMERRALRTNGVSGRNERQQPHGQRRDSPVEAVHGEPVVAPLSVPLMERRALRTNGVSGRNERKQPHGQRRDSPVEAVHGEPVISPLPVPLMERRALRTNGVSGRNERKQPHGQRRQRHPSNDGDDMSSSVRLIPSSSSRSMFEESLSASSSLRHPLCQQVEISESNLSGSESTRSSNPLRNVIDGDLGTRWATEGYASWLMVDLPEPTFLAGVAIDFGHKSTEPSNSQSFTLLVLGDYQVIHLPEVNAGRMGGLEYVEFEREIPARSVVLVGYGREGYTSLVEIQLCGGRVETSPTSVSPVKEEESVSSPPDGDDHRSSNRRTKKHLRGGNRL